jgi:hypothetical protein
VIYSYPLHYRTAFAFSSLLYPLPRQLALRHSLPPRGRSIGLTLFRLYDTNDVVPACTPAASVSVCSKCRWKQPAACLLAGAYQRLWLCGDDGAYGSSHVLDISFSLPLSPLRRLQCGRTPRGVLPNPEERGWLSRQLFDPAVTGHADVDRLLRTEPQVQLTNPPVLNNHSNDFKSHCTFPLDCLRRSHKRPVYQVPHPARRLEPENHRQYSPAGTDEERSAPRGLAPCLDFLKRLIRSGPRKG